MEAVTACFAILRHTAAGPVEYREQLLLYADIKAGRNFLGALANGRQLTAGTHSRLSAYSRA